MKKVSRAFIKGIPILKKQLKAYNEYTKDDLVSGIIDECGGEESYSYVVPVEDGIFYSTYNQFKPYKDKLVTFEGTVLNYIDPMALLSEFGITDENPVIQRLLLKGLTLKKDKVHSISVCKSGFAHDFRLKTIVIDVMSTRPSKNQKWPVDLLYYFYLYPKSIDE